MKIINEFDNSLLKRKEVSLEESYDSNPGYENVTKDVASHFKVGEDVIVVRRVGSSFGSDKFVIDAYVYDNEEAKNKIEPKNKEERSSSSPRESGGGLPSDKEKKK